MYFGGCWKHSPKESCDDSSGDQSDEAGADCGQGFSGGGTAGSGRYFRADSNELRGDRIEFQTLLEPELQDPPLESRHGR